MQYKLHTAHKKIVADTLTPVSIYLKLRDQFEGSFLLESSDYHTSENSFSYICCNPLASFNIEKGNFTAHYPKDRVEQLAISTTDELINAIQDFSSQFETETLDFKFVSNGLFGYTSYDAVQYFESVELDPNKPGIEIPEMHYTLFQNIIAIDHFKNEAYLFCHSLDKTHNLDRLEKLLREAQFSTFSYTNEGATTYNMSDEAFKSLVTKAKEHCQRGDVFQLVLSRRTEQRFKGDEFNVYRALRSINPSPYLFYFDYTDFKLFGSSPEAQLIVQNGRAEIHPIAGTYRRTGNDEQDAALAKKLSEDEKENAEHVMLVDLARNDLSRNGTEIDVKTYREVQYFSHVIHLVSKVIAKKQSNVSSLQLMADTFPAGTLSGAPKPMALRLIERYEPTKRGYYGGAIGIFDFNDNYNHAILIRSFLSHQSTLYYQAGAGIVASSSEESELQETYNKLGALQKALELAETL